MKKISILTLACVAIALTPSSAHAGLINGSQLNISGDATVFATAINWKCDQPGDTVCTAVPPPANKGDFSVTSSSGSFAPYNGTFGLITNINNAAQPLNQMFSLPNFLTFDLVTANNLTMELQFIPLGTDTLSTTCAGITHCTPQNSALNTPSNPNGISAFNLDQNGTGTAASFGVIGLIHAQDGSTAPISGIFTAQFNGLNPQQVLALTVSGANSTYSSNLSLTIVPEPTTLLLTGLGLIGLSILGRKVRS